MTGKDFAEWLGARWPDHQTTGNRLMLFAAHLQEVRGKGISIKAIEKWLERDAVPEWVAPFLPQIEARLANPAKPHLFTLTLALSASEVKALKRTAKKAHSTPEQFLELCARIGFEDQCGIE